MSVRRLIVIFFSVSLLIASCGGDAGSSTTSSSLEGDFPCFYLNNFVAVAPQEGSTAAETADQAANQLGIPGANIGAASILDATSIEHVTDDQPDFQSMLDAGAAIDEILGFVDVGEDDPLARAADLADAGFTAAPIQTIGLANHIKFAPGTDAIALTANPIGDVNPGGDSTVGVVDTGIIAEGPEWLTDSVVHDTIDVEQQTEEDPPSHGTFVAGIIRQVAPSYRVSLVKAREADVDKMRVEAGHDGLDQLLQPTSELHVFEAIARLMARHEETGIPVAALNISLGGYDCESNMLTMQLAISQWLNKFPNAPVFAAGGNDNVTETFFPAAFDEVTGVGAADLAGVETVWDSSNTPKAAPPRDWTDGNVVPGSNIVNIGKPTQAFVWSGSSFATAVASALYVSGKSLTPQYTNVPGLTFQITPGANEASLLVDAGGRVVDTATGNSVTLP